MPAPDTAGRIRDRLAAHGLSPTVEQLSGLAAYIGLLTKWNKTVNLTALALQPLGDEAIDRLLGEPLLAARFIAHGRGLLLDVGSGSGSPAIPIEIVQADLALVMVESRVRKSAFLREAIRQLGLDRTEVATRRLEQLAVDPKFQGSADLISIRAVRADPGLWRSLSALLAPDGQVFWFRSEPATVPEQLDYSAYFQMIATHPLIEVRRSELAILGRRDGD